MHAGDEAAADLLVRSNLRLVWRIVSEFVGKDRQYFDELFSEGIRGLLRALECFDTKRDTGIATYAALWIRQRVQRHLTSIRGPFRLPLHTDNQLRKALYFRSTGHSDEALCKRLELSPNQLRNLLASRIKEVSLDSTAPTSYGGEVSYASLIPDENADTRATFEARLKGKTLQLMLAQLPPRNADVLRARFALAPYTRAEALETIGKRHGVSRERIRQIQRTTLLRLRRLFEKAGNADMQGPVLTGTRMEVKELRARALKKRRRKEADRSWKKAHKVARSPAPTPQETRAGTYWAWQRRRIGLPAQASPGAARSAPSRAAKARPAPRTPVRRAASA